MAQVSIGLVGFPKPEVPTVEVRSLDNESARLCSGKNFVSIDLGEGVKLNAPGFDLTTVEWLLQLGDAVFAAVEELRRRVAETAAQALPQVEAPASSSEPESHPEGTSAGGTVNWFAGQQIDPVEEDLI